MFATEEETEKEKQLDGIKIASNFKDMKSPSLTIRSLAIQYCLPGWQTTNETIKVTAKLSRPHLYDGKWPGQDTVKNFEKSLAV